MLTKWGKVNKNEKNICYIFSASDVHECSSVSTL
jgi:hypothetical protein